MSQAADRYAKTLFEVSREGNSLEAVEGALAAIKKAMAAVPDFRLFLNNPLLSQEERSGVLKALFESKVPGTLYQFLLFITYKGRLNLLEEIIGSFDELYLSSKNQMRAKVTTAWPLTEEDKALVNQRLKDRFKHEMATQWILDPDLIGGFRIWVEDKIYDYSFKNQLNHFLQQST